MHGLLPLDEDPSKDSKNSFGTQTRAGCVQFRICSHSSAIVLLEKPKNSFLGMIDSGLILIEHILLQSKDTVDGGETLRFT